LLGLLTRRVPPPSYIAHSQDGYCVSASKGERTAIRQPGMEPSLFLGPHTRWGPARVDGLHSRRFSEPVTVHRTHADGTVHPTLIITTML
jgi:hypothetical protein